jgi:hypothetical protein
MPLVNVIKFFITLLKIFVNTGNDKDQWEMIFYSAAYKNYLWNTTTQDQLNALALLNIHRETGISPNMSQTNLKILRILDLIL